jgi:hypothetical protein
MQQSLETAHQDLYTLKRSAKPVQWYTLPSDLYYRSSFPACPIYGPSDRAESIATIHAALDADMTLLERRDGYRRLLRGAGGE